MAYHHNSRDTIAADFLGFCPNLATCYSNFNVISCATIDSLHLGHTTEIYILNQVSYVSPRIMSFDPYLITTDSHLMRNRFSLDWFCATGQNVFEWRIIFVIVSVCFARNRVSSSKFKSCNL